MSNKLLGSGIGVKLMTSTGCPVGHVDRASLAPGGRHPVKRNQYVSPIPRRRELQGKHGGIDGGASRHGCSDVEGEKAPPMKGTQSCTDHEEFTRTNTVVRHVLEDGGVLRGRERHRRCRGRWKNDAESEKKDRGNADLHWGRP